MRLIDANAFDRALAAHEFDAALMEADDHDQPYEHVAMYYSTQSFRDVMRCQPTINAVPVVRCKDCKYWALADRYDGLGYGACTYYKTIVRKGVLLSENFFCADGTRMGGWQDSAST